MKNQVGILGDLGENAVILVEEAQEIACDNVAVEEIEIVDRITDRQKSAIFTNALVHNVLF